LVWFSGHWHGSARVCDACCTGRDDTLQRGEEWLTGFFNTVYGLAWFAGSFVMGIIYGFSPTLMVIVSVTLELLAALLIFVNRHSLEHGHEA